MYTCYNAAHKNSLIQQQQQLLTTTTTTTTDDDGGNENISVPPWSKFQKR